ncbi:MAG TPA: cupin domain-containing protein [Gammaproteobacteria bacterium]|nr:cupin domain-containing protein [Luteimonas sp.]HRO28251.1 cupin domain-containing protein [Luteimonas sp.]HRP35920.1 cupin domain-containing protein [Gammaproteobacteria bacterium]HRP72103.1 cupin domain-containing protein [Luteimonas sp.]
MKKGYVDNIEDRTLENTDFRRVLYTGAHLQLVLMSLQPGEEIGKEVHPGTDQFFRVEQGKATVLIDGVSHTLEDDEIVIVPAGAEHNVINAGDAPLKLYTLYAPPEHRDGTVHATTAIAKAQHDADHYDGKPTE